MYKTPLELSLRDFIEAQETPANDEIHVIRPTCDDDGEIVKAETVYSGDAGSVNAETGAQTVNAVNCDYWRNQSGYWYIELLPMYVSGTSGTA